MTQRARRVEEGTPNDHWRCVCHDRRVVIKFNGGNGMTFCAVSRVALFSGFPPGWRSKIAKDRAASLAERYRAGELTEEQYVEELRRLA